MMAETYLRRGKRRLRQWLRDPNVRLGLWIALYGGGGFFLSAAALRGTCLPLGSALVLVMTGWRTVAVMLGAMAGYRVFWGQAGLQGVLWSAAAGMTALLVGRKKWFREDCLLTASVSAAWTAAAGLAFRVLWGEETPLALYFLRVAAGGASAALWSRVLGRRDALTDWLAGGAGVLALSQVMPIPGLGLGYGAAGLISVTSALPGAALAGLGMDLARVTEVPMTAVMILAYLLRLIPFSRSWIPYAAPAAACVGVMAVCGIWDLYPLPGLLMGGALGLLLPPRPETVYRRGPTGAAQVRLEMSAQVMARMQQMLLEQEEGAVDREALLEKARQRACGRCSFQKTCAVGRRLTVQQLEDPMSISCRKTGRLLAELCRSRDQLRVMQSQRSLRREYRAAMLQQYRFLSGYLHRLADQIPRREARRRASYRIEVSARTRQKEHANGDRCLAFPGVGCRYYVLLCDGMGTGLGAAEESRTAGNLLRQMLAAGMPPEYALGSLNALLTPRPGPGGSADR